MLTKRPTTYYAGYDYENNKEIYVFEIDVADTSELPDTEINGDIIGNGSIAHIITTGDFYSYNYDNHSWYNQDGSDTPTSESEAEPLSETNIIENIPLIKTEVIDDDEHEFIRDIESKQDTEIS